MKRRGKEKLKRWYIGGKKAVSCRGRKEGTAGVQGRPVGWAGTAMPRETGCFQEICRPPGHSSLVTSDRSPPWPPEIPGSLSLRQMFKRGGGSCIGLAWSPGELQRLVEEITSSLARQGVPWRWSWASTAQTGNTGGGRAEGPADTSWPAGSAGSSHGHLPWILGVHRPVLPGLLWP